MSDLHLVRISAKQAGYMELPGAEKDGDCRKVEVKGGISQKLGCCNLFELGKDAEKQFRCGTCEYHLKPKDDPGARMLEIVRQRKKAS